LSAGLAGLTAAATAARRGVLVIEQLAPAGGSPIRNLSGFPEGRAGCPIASGATQKVTSIP